MATELTHAFVAASLGAAVFPSPLRSRAISIGVVCSVLPDIDAVGYHLGIPYHHLAGHRGLTHSLIFAAALGVVSTVWLCRNQRWFPLRYQLLGYLFALTASHGFLDAMTNGGLGIAFFSPISSERFFLPLRPLAVAPLTVSGLFTSYGLRVIETELTWIWLPWTALLVAVSLSRRHGERRETRRPGGTCSPRGRPSGAGHRGRRRRGLPRPSA